jgi:hypothetical protein
MSGWILTNTDYLKQRWVLLAPVWTG